MENCFFSYRQFQFSKRPSHWSEKYSNTKSKTGPAHIFRRTV